MQGQVNFSSTEKINIIHRVERGESLGDISKRYRTPAAIIVSVNRLNEGVYPGQRLLIPRVEGKVYRVKPGDSAGEIAKKFGISEQKLLSDNKTSEIYPFMELIINN